MGGEGSTPGIELIYENAGMDVCVGLNTGMEGYAAMDGLVRLFVGDDPKDVDTGIGIQVCDADHNLPPKGEVYETPVDYAAGFQENSGRRVGRSCRLKGRGARAACGFRGPCPNRVWPGPAIV